MFPTPVAPLIDPVDTVTGGIEMMGIMWTSLGLAIFVAAAIGWKQAVPFAKKVITLFRR